jgi:molybdenum cofactor cytidylyltransferase
MVSAVILAAGTSSRMGVTKQLLPLRGSPLLQHVVDRASQAGLEEVIVVLGHDAAAIRASLVLPSGARTVVNSDYASGQASSLRAGLAAADPRATAALILLGDQPEVRPEAIRAVVERYEETGGPVVRARYGDEPGHPVLLDRSAWDELIARAAGDRGAGPVLQERPEWVVWAPIAGAPPNEVDTPEDFERLSG